jgi:adenylate cyclase
MTRLTISLLGPLQVILDGEPVTAFESDKVRALLAYLAVEADRPHRRETLAGLFWPERPERSARHNLSQALFNLRRAIGDHGATPPFLLITHQTVQFNKSSDCSLDATALTALLAACEEHCRRRLEICDRCVDRLQQAVALYRGSFIEGFSLGDSPAFEEWSVLQRERFHRLAVDALHHLARCHEEQGELEQALQYAWRWVELDPWREEAHRQLMGLYARTDHRTAALRQYRLCMRILEEELGAPPSEETTALYQRIRSERADRTEREIVAAAPTPPSSPLPHPPPFISGKEPAEVERSVFVAREPELAQLSRSLDAALAGEGQVVFITGGAGRGKTALMQEFARRALDAHPDLLVAVGNCNAYSGVGDPYLPFRELLGMLTGDVEARWAAGAITRELASRLWALLPVAVQALLDHGSSLIGIFLSGAALLSRVVTVTPDGAGWLGGLRELSEREKAKPGDGSTEPAKVLAQSQLFEQYTNVLHALAAQCPLLLILDDMQWADAASISLFFHLGRRLKGSRILMASAYRPDEVAFGRPATPPTAARQMERHPLEKLLAEFKRRFGDVWVDLTRADETGGRKFIEALLDMGPNRLGEDFRGALFRRTGGHPLFTVELLRAMQERGDLVRDRDGEWVEGSALHWERLPARVEAVIEERVGRLEEGLRDILTVASVEGESFTAQVVARVQDVREREVLRALSKELGSRHRLVREREEVQVGGRFLSHYQFAHVLFQGYLYDKLGAGERRLLHGEIAAALEELYGDQAKEIAPQLARHYAEAGEVEKAVAYLSCAGDRALLVYAHKGAIDHYRQALSLLPKGPTLPEEGVRRRAAVLIKLGNAYYQVGNYSLAIQRLEEGLALAHRAGDPQMEVGALNCLGEIAWQQGACDVAGRHLKRGLTLARKCDDWEGIARALRHLGYIAYLQGENDEAKKYAGESLALYRELGDRSGVSDALDILSFVATVREEYDVAERYLEESLAICREVGERRGEARCLLNLGENARRQGKYGEAKRCYERGLPISREVGDRAAIAACLNNLGHVHAGLGGDGAAWVYLRQALNESLAIEAVPFVLEGLIGVAGLQAKAGRYVEAARLLGLILGHPAGHEVTKWYADPLLATLREVLPADRLEAALKRGRELNLEAVVAEILGGAAK